MTKEKKTNWWHIDTGLRRRNIFQARFGDAEISFERKEDYNNGRCASGMEAPPLTLRVIPSSARRE
ncbi:MAG: hypothetical protein WBW71_11335 [Bacteroidota bacterium]